MPLDGFLIIDKPPKVISHELTTWLKKLLKVKTGHAGTLDPDVTGVFPVALGKSTKLLQYISSNDKTYIGIIKFKNKQIDDSEIKNLFSEFTGKIWQVPPTMSAVKKVKRKRTVYSLDFLERDGPFVLFKTKVEAGTYIRTLCEDIGKKCGGARMEELRRIAVGDINEKQAIKLHKLVDFCKSGKLQEIIIPPDSLIKFPKVEINKHTIEPLLNGATITKYGIVKCERFGVEELVSVYYNNTFVGVGLSLVRSKEIDTMKSGFVIKMKRTHVTKSQLL